MAFTDMTVRARNTAVLVFICLVVSLLLWWRVASDYSDTAISGRYTFAHAGVQCTLVLGPDHTFTQELKRDGTVRRATGTWRRVGEGGVSFSDTFLPLPGEEADPDGTSFADVDRTFGIFISLRLRRYHVVWYGGKHDSGPGGALLGTYEGDEDGALAKLKLNADHSFQQEIARAGKTNRAEGTWSLEPNGNIKFSETFLKTSGQPLNADESATAEQPRSANLQITVANVSAAGTSILRKKRLPW